MDTDGDGVTVTRPGVVCSAEELPPGHTDVSNGDDCDDADPTVWVQAFGFLDVDGDAYGTGSRLVLCTDGSTPEGYAPRTGDCAPEDSTRWRELTYYFRDADGDGYTAPESGTVCTAGSLPDPYRTDASGNDCDDADPALYRWVVLYADHDGDGVGAPPRWVPCLGDEIPDGWSLLGYDADDDNPDVQTAADEDDLVDLLF